MTIETTLISRSGGKCELCSAREELAVYQVPPDSDGSAEQSLLICCTCQDEVENPDGMDANHWRCLIKDLNVKGAGFTAKRGTAVRNISLVPNNCEHIEGRVNGQQIVIHTKFVKKSN